MPSEDRAEYDRAISQRQVETARERAEERDGAAVMSDVVDELGWCEKESLYVVTGAEHPHAEKRVGRIRKRLAEIDAMLGVIESRARGGSGDE